MTKPITVNDIEVIKDKLEDNPDREPALTYGATLSATISGLFILRSLLFPNFLSDEVFLLIATGMAGSLPLVTSFFIRNKVWSPKSVLDVLNSATQAGIKTAQDYEARKKRSL